MVGREQLFTCTMEKSLIPRKKQKQGEKTIKFMTFAERIHAIRSTFDVVQRQRYVQSALEHQNINIDNLHFSYFCEAVTKWRSLDNSEEYVAFCRALSALKVHNYAQVVLLKDQLVSLILEHLRVADTPALVTLCDLLAELAKDLQDEIGPRWSDVVGALNGQLISCQDADKIEAVFACLALVIRILSQSVAKYGLQTVLRQFLPLFNSRRSYIQEFAAQSMAFLVRANQHNRDMHATAEALVQLSCENERTARSVSFLLHYAVKRSKLTLFSWAPALLKLLFGYELSHDGDLSREVHFRTMLISLTKLLLQHLFDKTPRQHSHPESDDAEVSDGEKRTPKSLSSSVKDSKVMVSELLLEQLQETSSLPDSKHDRIVRMLLVFEAALAFRSGAIFDLHAPRLVGLLTTLANRLPSSAIAETDSQSLLENLLKCVTLVLLPPSTLVASDVHQRRNLIKSVVHCANIDLRMRLDFAANLLSMPLFEIEVLPFVAKACETIDVAAEPLEWNMVVQHFVAVVMRKHHPPSSGETLRSYLSTPFSFSFPKLYDYCVGVVEDCIRIGKVPNITNLAHSLILLPHLPGAAQQTTTSSLVHRLFCRVLAAFAMEPENVVYFARTDAVTHTLLLALLALALLDREAASNCFDLKSLCFILSHNMVAGHLPHDEENSDHTSCVIQTVKLPALLLADYVLTLSSPKTITPADASKIYHIVRFNLANGSHRCRLLTLRVLKACFSDSDDNNIEVAGVGNLFNNALISEAVESNAFNFREKLVCFRRLEYEFVRKVSNNSTTHIEMALLFLLGSLHEQFQPLWKPLIEIICSYEEFLRPTKGTPTNALNMPLMLLKLYDNVADAETPSNADEERNETLLLLSSFGLTESNDVRDRAPGRSVGNTKYRQHLLEIYAKLNNIFERAPRALVDRFIYFVEHEYLPSVGMKSLLGEPAHTISLTKRDDADNNGAADDEDGLVVKTDSSVRSLSRNDAETLLVGWLNVLSAFPNPGAFYKRSLLAQMFEQLLMSSNTSIQKAALECHLRMPSEASGGVKNAVDPRRILRKYKLNFDRMLDDKTFRKELVLFSLESASALSANAPNADGDENAVENGAQNLPSKKPKKSRKSIASQSPDDDNRPQTLDAADRASVMPVMLRILIGRLKSKRALAANSTVEAKRRTIVRFVSASASAQEITDFLALALLPARVVFEVPASSTLMQHIENLLTMFTVDKMFVLSQFYAVMSLVRVCAATLGRLAPEQVARKIFESSIIMLVLSENFLNDESKRSRISPHFVERLKALRAISYETLTQTLDCYRLRLDDTKTQLLPTLWQYVLWPNSQLFATDGLVHPTLLMRLCATKLSKQPKLWPLLFAYSPQIESRDEALDDEKVDAKNTLFGKLVQILEFAGSGTKSMAKPGGGTEHSKSAQSFDTVLTCVLNLINATNADAERENNADSTSSATANQQLSPSHLVAALDGYHNHLKLLPYYRTQLSAGFTSTAELGSALLVPYADTVMHFMLKQMQKHPVDSNISNPKRSKLSAKDQRGQRGIKRTFDNKSKNAENSSSASKTNSNSTGIFVFTSQHLLLLRSLAQHVTDRRSCSSLATLLMLRLDRSPKPRSADALLTTTGRRKRKGPDTLITEVETTELNENDHAAQLQNRLLTQTEEILDTLCQLVARCAQPRQFVNPIFQLFASTRHMSARVKVCDLLKNCAQAIQNAEDVNKAAETSSLNDFVVPLAYQLNSYDRRMLNEPDYTQRVEAYKQAVVQFKQLIPDEIENRAEAAENPQDYYRHRDLVHLILHQACFDLMYTSDLGLRENAKEALRVLFTAFLRRINVVDPKNPDGAEIRLKFIGEFVLTLLLPILHVCLKARDDEVRHDFIQILRMVVEKCPAGADENFDALRVLMDASNPEHDYFDNLCHIQIPRRLAAIRKVTQSIRSGALARVPAISQYVLPTALVYLCNAQHVGQTNLHTICLDLLGVTAQRMTCSYLPIYMSYLQRYATIMMTPVSRSNRETAGVGQQNRLKFQKQAIKIVCKLLDSCPISVVVPPPPLPGAAPQRPVNYEKLAVELMQLNDAADDSGIEISTPPEAALPLAVNKLINLLMPVLDSFLALPTGGTRRHQTVADAAETDKLNDMMILKAPITVAVVKLLRKLPAELTDKLLPRIAQALANMLRSRLKSVRGAARECLQEILLTLRHVKFFKVINTQLCAVLTRGYQLHVLTYTVNFLLTNAAVQFMRPGDADEIADQISTLCRNELFSEVPSEEKNVDKVRQQTFEAAHTTSYSMLTVLMRFMSAERVRTFLLKFLTQAESLASNSSGGDNKSYRHRIEWKTSSTAARVNAAAAQPVQPAPTSMLMPGSSSSRSVAVRDSAAAAPVGTSLWQYRVVLKKCQLALAQGLALNKGIKHDVLLTLIGEMCSSALAASAVKPDADETSDFNAPATVTYTKSEAVEVVAENLTEKTVEIVADAEVDKPQLKLQLKPKGRFVGGKKARPAREPPQVNISELPVVCKVFVVQLCIQVAAQFTFRNSKLLSKVKDENSKVVKAMNDLAPRILACLEDPEAHNASGGKNQFSSEISASSTSPAVTRHLMEFYPLALAVLTTCLSMALPCFVADEQRATQLLNILLVMLMQYTKNNGANSSTHQNELLSGIYSCLTAFIRHSNTTCEQLLLNGEKMDIILSYVENDLTMASHTRLALELVRACVQQNYDLPALHGEIRTDTGQLVISRYSQSDDDKSKSKSKKRYFDQSDGSTGGKKAFLGRQPSLLKTIISTSHVKLEISNSLIKTIAELGVRSVDTTTSSGTKQLCINIVSMYLTKYLDSLDAVHSNKTAGSAKNGVVPLDDDDRHVLMLTKLLRRAYMQFLCSNLQYEYQGGRLAALEMLDALVGNYDRARLAKYNQPSYLFMLLARIISTDDSEACRQLARTVLIHLLQRVAEKERQALFNLATNWLSFSAASESTNENDAESPLKSLLMKKMAFQVLEIFFDAVPHKQTSDGAQTNLLLPIVQSYLLEGGDKLAAIANAGSSTDAETSVDTDQSQRLADHVLFACVSVADKLLLRFFTLSSKKPKTLENGQKLLKAAEPAKQQDIIECIANVFDLLLHENAMIRHKVIQMALRIVQHGCKVFRQQQPNVDNGSVVRRTSQYQKALMQLLFSEPSNAGDSETDANENNSAKRLLLDSITVLHSVPENDAAFRTNLVQLLSCEVELLILGGTTKSDEPEQQQNFSFGANSVTFRHFVSRIIRVALEEMATTPKQFSRRSLVLQWLKTVVQNASTADKLPANDFQLERWTTLLKCSMPILYRCMTTTAASDTAAATVVPQDVRELADFVGAKLRQHVGVDTYTAAMQHVQQAMRKAKAERKQRASELALTRPEKAAQMKIKKQLQKRDLKKRKNAEMQDMRESGFIISGKNAASDSTANAAGVSNKKKRRVA